MIGDGRDTVLLDFFGVIAHGQDSRHAAALQTASGMRATEFTGSYWAHRAPYDLKRLDGKQYWERVLGRRLEPAEAAWFVETDVRSWSRVDTAMVAVVERLSAARISLGVVSDMPWDFLCWHSRHTRVLSLFDDVAASCETGFAKPDSAAFLAALRRLRREPGQAVLIDDDEDNVRAAARLGIRAIHFTGLGALVDELDAAALKEM